jgi:uncharacterized protein (DUF433 family)
MVVVGAAAAANPGTIRALRAGVRHDYLVAPLQLLDRPLYDEVLAASVLDMSRSTLHWWLEGGDRNGRHYEPVLRAEPTGSKEVTWGELVEARYLRAYRRDLGVKLGSLRAFISYLRETLGVPYPLAHARPWVGADRHLLVAAQSETELDPDLWVAYEPPTGVVLLTAPAESFLERVQFDEDNNGIVVRLRPAGPNSPVIIDPEVRFGSPMVAGIPTETLDEMVHAGDSIESVAVGYELSLDDVVAALDYERLRRQLAA